MTSAQSSLDDELVVRAGKGDHAAVASLVSRKLPRVLSLARRMLGDLAEAEDVAQEAFLKVWKFAPRWRPGQAKFDTWLHRVTLNLCYDRLRRPSRASGDDSGGIDPGPGPDRGLLASDVGRRVDLALAALPARQREAIALCHYQELTNGEAAAIMGVSVEAMESLLSRARRSLRFSLADMANHG